MTRLSSNQQLKVLPTLSRTTALTGITSTLQCLFSIDSKTEIPPSSESSPQSRAPINICIVLDVSGSMSGAKLENCKKAIQEILCLLQENDLISFVIYSSTATRVFHQEQLSSKQQLIKLSGMIEKQRCGGDTNIGAGLDLAAASLATKDEASPRLSRIFLFSDGQVTSGETRKSVLFAKASSFRNRLRIFTTTFGIGHDFDDEMMVGLSKEGGGAFYFIGQPDDIQPLVKQATSSLMNLLATEATLVVRGLGFGLVKKIFGHPNLQKGADLGELRTQNVREVLVEFEVSPPGGVQTNVDEEILSYYLEFVPVSNEGQKERIEGSVKIKFVSDPNLIDEENKETRVALAIQKAAETQEEVVKHLKEGRTSEALRMEKVAHQVLSSVQQYARSPLIEQQQAQSVHLQSMILNSGSSPLTVQAANHSAYQKRRRSIDYDNAYSSIQSTPEPKRTNVESKHSTTK